VSESALHEAQWHSV